ncbi:GAF domain-containing protein [Kushneria indalinina]|uniref:GAF domain-containing protein n=1 Tax=Kushneria indalinina DSM 14324 TaxID=1122140 RepID=A0A3D9E034_9GAMM|nr:GAF domain-containing protein [Kushneria indalinina]REC96397.1 GAF domain-containing protein [Kushneria indalinina DSM 14324]
MNETHPTTDYAMLKRQLAALLDTRDWVTNTSQMAAFIFQQVPELNWAGFYIQREERVLRLGPFQGQPACNPIEFEAGVCGAAARTRQTQRVEDVHAFPGHIACDAASRSELVVPLISNDRLWGVLDLDSPLPGRFALEDQEGIEALCQVLMDQTDLPDLIG